MKTEKATRILVVDDFRSFREWIRSRLDEHTEFEIVGEASTGQEAVQMAELLIPELILLDLGLPDINGIETGKRIARILPLAKILFLYSYAQGDVVESALSDRANGYLFKGDAERELVPVLEAVRRGDSFATHAQKTGQRRILPPLNLALST